MRYRRLVAVLLAIILALICIRRPLQRSYFIPFDEAQIQNHYSPKDVLEFYQRLGKKKWKLVRHLYNTHLYRKKIRQKKERIPKIIHQLALDGAPSQEQALLAQSWIDYHPDWEYHLWTDLEIEVLYLQNRNLYDTATDPKIKSKILRYEILYQFGGVFVDEYIQCIQPFDILHETCDFYAGAIDTIHHPEICPSIIGAIPCHPILRKCIKKFEQKNWGNCSSGFLTHCFFETLKKRDKERNVILPATYFYPLPERKRNSSNIDLWIQSNTFAINYWGP